MYYICAVQMRSFATQKAHKGNVIQFVNHHGSMALSEIADKVFQELDYSQQDSLSGKLLYLLAAEHWATEELARRDVELSSEQKTALSVRPWSRKVKVGLVAQPMSHKYEEDKLMDQFAEPMKPLGQETVDKVLQAERNNKRQIPGEILSHLLHHSRRQDFKYAFQPWIDDAPESSVALVLLDQDKRYISHTYGIIEGSEFLLVGIRSSLENLASRKVKNVFMLSMIAAGIIAQAWELHSVQFQSSLPHIQDRLVLAGMDRPLPPLEWNRMGHCDLEREGHYGVTFQILPMEEKVKTKPSQEQQVKRRKITHVSLKECSFHSMLSKPNLSSGLGMSSSWLESWS